MKRISAVVIFALLLISGCSKNNANVPKIEEYEWMMFSVQSMEDGQALVYGKRSSSTLDTTKQMELTCTADNGSLTITDKTNNKSYSGTYKLTETSSQSNIYEVVVNGMEGMAVVSMTTYRNGEDEPTFIISLEEYSINFYAE